MLCCFVWVCLGVLIGLIFGAGGTLKMCLGCWFVCFVFGCTGVALLYDWCCYCWLFGLGFDCLVVFVIAWL